MEKECECRKQASEKATERVLGVGGGKCPEKLRKVVVGENMNGLCKREVYEFGAEVYLFWGKRVFEVRW